MNNKVTTKNIMIGIKTREGDYMIMPVTFQLDNGNNFKPIYHSPVNLGGETLEFLKVTHSGRMLYKQL